MSRACRIRNCFNPTLVRLRSIRRAQEVLRAPGFQSHAGSIEVASISSLLLRLCWVSIPRWFD